MSDPMTLSVDKKVVEQVIMNKVEADVAASFSGIKDELIERMVRIALHTKVTHSGEISTRSYDSTVPMLEYLVHNEIRNMASESIKNIVVLLRPQLEKRIRESFRKDQDKLVKAMMQSLESQVSDKWRISFDVKINKD